MISQVNEIYENVIGKAQKCKDNMIASTSESFSKMMTGFISDEADIVSFPNAESVQASEKEQFCNNYFTTVVYLPLDVQLENLTEHTVHNMSLGKPDGYDELNINFDKHSCLEENDLHESYKGGHYGRLHAASKNVNELMIGTESKYDLQNQLIGLSESEDRAYSSHPVKTRDIMFNESITVLENELSSIKKQYHVSNVDADTEIIHESIRKHVSYDDLSKKSDATGMPRYSSSIIESSDNKSDLAKPPKQAEITLQDAEQHETISFSEEVKSFKELQHGVRYVHTDNYNEFSTKVTGHSLAYKDSSALIPDQSKLANEQNLDQSNENIKEFSIGQQNGQEPTFAHFQRNSYSDSSFGSSGAEQFWEHNDAEKIDPSFKNALFNAAYQFDIVSKLPEALDKITSKEDILSLVADRLKVMSGEGITELEIKIHPESLGKLILKVVNENGLYSAQITAEVFQTKELLESNLNDLKALLKEQGFDFTRLDVNLSNNQSNNRQWAWQDRFFSGRNNFGSFASGLRDPISDRVENTYSGLKVSGHIDCLV